MTKIFLIGAGPGDPELVTLKAAKILARAEVVMHDSLVDPRIVAMANPAASIIDVGKRCGRHSARQETISEMLVAQARTGRLVVRLKGGDPMIFGRATEEMEALRGANIDFEVIPGVTAASAAAAGLRISLTRRDTARTLHILTGHGAEGGMPGHDFIGLTRSGGIIAIYMGGETVAGLATHFIEAGMAPDTPAILVENASLPNERHQRATIATLPALHAAQPATGPVLILVGEALHAAETRAAQEVAAAS
jgi:uroporphyrin-III C-methyltransferase/precorrin-2 dehydrogenase/sirohydrochlorin ferrochelatase/uroporphyrin-III C-methyltransferase